MLIKLLLKTLNHFLRRILNLRNSDKTNTLISYLSFHQPKLRNLNRQLILPSKTPSNHLINLLHRSHIHSLNLQLQHPYPWRMNLRQPFFIQAIHIFSDQRWEQPTGEFYPIDSFGSNTRVHFLNQVLGLLPELNSQLFIRKLIHFSQFRLIINRSKQYLAISLWKESFNRSSNIILSRVGFYYFRILFTGVKLYISQAFF